MSKLFCKLLPPEGVVLCCAFHAMNLNECLFTKVVCCQVFGRSQHLKSDYHTIFLFPRLCEESWAMTLPVCAAPGCRFIQGREKFELAPTSSCSWHPEFLPVESLRDSEASLPPKSLKTSVFAQLWKMLHSALRISLYSSEQDKQEQAWPVPLCPEGRPWKLPASLRCEAQTAWTLLGNLEL